MTHYFQPENSSTCGQHCVAMITDQDPEYIIKNIFKSRGGTRTKQVYEALLQFGLEGSSKLIRLKPVDYSRFFSDGTYIVKVKWLNAKLTHWMVIYDGMVYCSGYGTFICTNSAFNLIYGVITSYMKVIKF